MLFRSDGTNDGRKVQNMRYVISDIHGCYAEYLELLDKIHFSDRDELYVLGDAMDRGPDPIKVIQDLMMRSNVVYVVGNHDYMMLRTLKKLAVEITEENYRTHLTSEDFQNWYYWMQDGGRVTADQFRVLPRDEQWEILDYLGDAQVYALLEDRGRQFIMVHAGLRGFKEYKALDEYDVSDFIFKRTDYNKRYYQDPGKIVVTGHTPTLLIRPDGLPLIYQGNGQIALDCGCVFGGNLAAYCIETEETVYVKSRQQRVKKT